MTKPILVLSTQSEKTQGLAEALAKSAEFRQQIRRLAEESRQIAEALAQIGKQVSQSFAGLAPPAVRFNQLFPEMEEARERTLQPLLDLERQIASQNKQYVAALTRIPDRTVIQTKPRAAKTRKKKPLIGFRPPRKV